MLTYITHTGRYTMTMTRPLPQNLRRIVTSDFMAVDRKTSIEKNEYRHRGEGRQYLFSRRCSTEEGVLRDLSVGGAFEEALGQQEAERQGHN